MPPLLGVMIRVDGAALTFKGNASSGLHRAIYGCAREQIVEVVRLQRTVLVRFCSDHQDRIVAGSLDHAPSHRTREHVIVWAIPKERLHCNIRCQSDPFIQLDVASVIIVVVAHAVSIGT